MIRQERFRGGGQYRGSEPCTPTARADMSRLIIGSRAELIAALRKQRPSPARAERVRALLQDMFLDALFLVAQFPGGQIAEANKCCYAFDVRACAGLCRATWAEEAFWSGLVRVQYPGPHGRTRLMYAADHGDAARVAWLLARGAPRETKDDYGFTALHHASWKGHTDAVRALLATGANVDAVMNDGVTSLRIAAYYGLTDVVRMLLTAGANVDAAQTDGAAPLYIAAQLGHTDSVRALLAAGANVEAASTAGCTPLYIAAQEGKIDALRALLATGANIDAATNDGATPLFIAAQIGHTDTVRALLAAGANVDAAMHDSTTPLYMAVHSVPTFVDVVRALLAAGANANAARNFGYRPLHAARFNGDEAIATLLLDAGADVNALTTTIHRSSPLALTSSPAMRALLVARGGV